MSTNRILSRTAALVICLSALPAAAATVVSLHFDDNHSTQRAANRALNARGLKATFYINTQFIGGGNYLNREDLAAFAAAGHEIAGHTLTHADLPTLSAAELERQICDDRETLVGWGFNPVSFAYPFGSLNASVIDATRACGYSNARTVGGSADSIPPGNVFAIQTQALVVPGTSVGQLQSYVTSAENAGGGLVSIVFHQVCDGCGSNSITEGDLTAFLDWLVSRGSVVRTMAQALGAPPPPPAVPAITNLSPAATLTGGPSFILRVNGARFTPGSAARWNGAARATSFVSTSALDVSIAAADIAASAIAAVTVADPAGVSNTASFSVAEPVPSVAALGPASIMVGAPAFDLTVDGSGFSSGAVVRWNGLNRPTTAQGSARLIARIPASDVAAPGFASVSVFNPAPGGGLSNALTFTTLAPVPSVAALDPASMTVGAPAFDLTVDGVGFSTGAVIRWNGLNRPTTARGPGRLIARIPESDAAAPGSALVTVFNPAPGGGVSNALTFAIGAIRPAADPSFAFREHYAFPNPSRRGQPVTIRVRSGAADAAEIRVYDVAGRLVRSGSALPAQIIDDLYTQDFVWSLSDAGSGVYLYTITVKKQGRPDIRRMGKIGVLK